MKKIYSLTIVIFISIFFLGCSKDFLKRYENDLRSNYVFKEYFYSVFAITEEAWELEEATNGYNKENIQEEAGDLIFYILQAAGRLVIIENFVEEYKVQDVLDSYYAKNLIVKPVNILLHENRKSVGRISGIVKKHLRSEKPSLSEKELKFLKGNLFDLFRNTLDIVYYYGFSPSVCLQLSYEKGLARLAKFKAEAEEQRI